MQRFGYFVAVLMSLRTIAMLGRLCVIMILTTLAASFCYFVFWEIVTLRGKAICHILIDTASLFRDWLNKTTVRNTMWVKNCWKRKNIVAVNLKAGRFYDIDSPVIISSVSKAVDLLNWKLLKVKLSDLLMTTESVMSKRPVLRFCWDFTFFRKTTVNFINYKKRYLKVTPDWNIYVNTIQLSMFRSIFLLFCFVSLFLAPTGILFSSSLLYHGGAFSIFSI